MRWFVNVPWWLWLPWLLIVGLYWLVVGVLWTLGKLLVGLWHLVAWLAGYRREARQDELQDR